MRTLTRFQIDRAQVRAQLHARFFNTVWPRGAMNESHCNYDQLANMFLLIAIITCRILYSEWSIQCYKNCLL